MASQRSSSSDRNVGLMAEADEMSRRLAEDIQKHWQTFQAGKVELENAQGTETLPKRVGFVPHTTSTPVTAPSGIQTPGRSWMTDNDIQGNVERSLERCLQRHSRDMAGRIKLPPVVAPKYKAGGDWKCFLAEFRDMIRLADMKPSHQLAYLKQSVPEEARKLLYQHRVENVEQALETLSELYEPVKDSWTVFQELEKISQQPGERLRVLAGRIEEKAERCAKAINLTTEALNDLVKSRFKHAIADEETKHQLLWDQTPQTMDAMVQKAQQFQDLKGLVPSKSKKAYRAKDEKQGTEKLQQEIQDLRKQLAELKSRKSGSPRRQSSFSCWNCGMKGHLSRNCQQPKIEDGFSFRPKNKRKGTQSSTTQTTQVQADKDLNC